MTTSERGNTFRQVTVRPGVTVSLGSDGSQGAGAVLLMEERDAARMIAMRAAEDPEAPLTVDPAADAAARSKFGSSFALNWRSMAHYLGRNDDRQVWGFAALGGAR